MVFFLYVLTIGIDPKQLLNILPPRVLVNAVNEAPAIAVFFYKQQFQWQLLSLDMC